MMQQRYWCQLCGFTFCWGAGDRTLDLRCPRCGSAKVIADACGREPSPEAGDAPGSRARESKTC